MRARAWLESGDARRASTGLDRYLERFPDHPSALLTRARALAKLARPAAAVADYTVAIGRLPAPEPDLFLERQVVQRDAGVSATAQLAGIEQGLQQIGSVPALEDAALDLELELSAYDAALARLDRQAARADRQERWQYRRGLVLAKAGREAAAAEAFRSALAHVARLSSQHRNARATAELVAQLQEEIARIDRRPEAPSLR